MRRDRELLPLRQQRRQQRSYSAEEASYSHHERYVYRSNDVEGRQASGTGKYFHLLLVNVLRGNPLKTSDV